jgi:hypothetical protein
MSITAIFEKTNGKYSATVAGIPWLRADGASQDDVVRSLTDQVRDGLANGSVILLDVESKGLSGIAGTYRDDPSLQDICDEAYQLRDAERDAEWPDANGI